MCAFVRCVRAACADIVGKGNTDALTAALPSCLMSGQDIPGVSVVSALINESTIRCARSRVAPVALPVFTQQWTLRLTLHVQHGRDITKCMPTPGLVWRVLRHQHTATHVQHLYRLYTLALVRCPCCGVAHAAACRTHA